MFTTYAAMNYVWMHLSRNISVVKSVFAVIEVSTVLEEVGQNLDPEPEAEAEKTLENGIPVSITHHVQRGSDPVWKVNHRLDSPVKRRNAIYTHTCVLCAGDPKLTWKQALCRVASTSYAKSHMLKKYLDHEIGDQERILREEVSSHIVAKTSPANSTKRDALSSNSQSKEKRQKRLWKVTSKEIT